MQLQPPAPVAVVVVIVVVLAAVDVQAGLAADVLALASWWSSMSWLTLPPTLPPASALTPMHPQPLAVAAVVVVVMMVAVDVLAGLAADGLVAVGALAGLAVDVAAGVGADADAAAAARRRSRVRCHCCDGRRRPGRPCR